MAFRVLTALAIVSAGFAASPGAANAQSFPLFRPFTPAQAQPAADNDDDVEPPSGTLSPPGIQSAPLPPLGGGAAQQPYSQQQSPQYPQQAARPMPEYPSQQAPQFARPANGQQQPYPAQQPYPQQSQQYPQYQQPAGNPTVLSPPGFILPDDERRPPLDPAYRQDQQRQDTARLPAGPGQDVPRPPGGVGSMAPVDSALAGPTVITATPAPGQPGVAPGQPAMVASLPPEDQPEIGEPKELPPNLKRQMVDYTTKEPAGTLIIDTANTYLYLVLGGGKALRYGIGVGREGFTWAGTERVTKMAEWPDWHPPAEMIERQPYLPRFMAGGEGNPLGARALYLGKTLYRIHGTNQPSTIGTFVSSGCVRLVNSDIEDLYGRVRVGARVVVLPGNPPATTAQAGPPAAAAPQQATR